MTSNRLRTSVMCVFLVSISGAAVASAIDDGSKSHRTTPSGVHQELQQRIEKVLDRWCRWLSGYVRPVPGTDLYTISPKLKQAGHPYRNVAGNQFAAAAAAYWLARANPDEAVARPLRGLVKLSLVSHMAVPPVEHPQVFKWGARGNVWGSDDWHADLFAGTSGMLMLPGLPPAQREHLLKILAWEADFDVGVEVGTGYTLPQLGGSSKGESNAWTTMLIQAARLALPQSPRQAAWREAAIRYSLNSICVPGDVASDRVVGGKPLKERVKGANFEPGGIQEHHGFYHPGYMGWPLALQAYAQMIDEMLPEADRNPDVYLHNWQLAFERLKQGTFANGRFIHCAGDDWNAYGYGNDHILPIGIVAGARYRDPDAVRLAVEWLALAEKQQAITGGPIQGSRLARLQHEYHNDFAWYEAISGATLACALWVLERADTSAMPAPATEEQYNARNVGTYYEPGARLVWCRDRHRWASCSWRSAFGEWQAIVQPVALPHLLKFNHNSTGILQAAGGVSTKKIVASSTGALEGGFWSLGTIERAATAPRAGKPLVQQHQALIALPEGPSIFVDLCEAMEPIEIERSLGLGLRLAADVFNDHQVHLKSGGIERNFPPHPECDTWHDLAARSVTIEKRLSIHALAGEGSFQLMQKRRRAPDFSESPYPGESNAVEESLLGHELYFGPPAGATPRKVAPGEWFRKLVLVSYCDSEQTPSEPSGRVTGEPPCMAVHLPEVRRTVVINFADGEAAAGTVKVGPRSVAIAAQ
ncbi:MAG: hypothetical protein HUU20_13060 [Pirellulales bacterium]|nr:hypothetical protein [Pirellulales bacterium]